MKPGSKYYPLYQQLRRCDRTPITLAIAEIETLINGTLPASARTQKAWWSNRSQGALQAAAWLMAGYRTTHIDLEQGKITFQKYEAQYRVQRIEGAIAWNADAIKALRKHMHLTQAQFAETLGVRRQTVSEWENGVYAPERSTTKHLGLIAEKHDFHPDQD